MYKEIVTLADDYEESLSEEQSRTSNNTQVDEPTNIEKQCENPSSQCLFRKDQIEKAGQTGITSIIQESMRSC